LLVAAIGEQLSEHLAEGDEICGITISCRRDQDLLQIWNTHSRLASEATIIDAVHKLLPDIRFSAEFYKCRHHNETSKQIMISNHYYFHSQPGARCLRGSTQKTLIRIFDDGTEVEVIKLGLNAKVFRFWRGTNF